MRLEKQNRDYNKGLYLLQSALEVDPSNYVVLSNLGYRYLKKGIDIDPKKDLMNGNVGNCLCELKNYTK